MLPFAPSAERNKDPILHALRPWLETRARVIEIGSGTAEESMRSAIHSG